MNRPTYVYDVREQFTQPVIVVYWDDNELRSDKLDKCLAGLYGRMDWICAGRPDWLLVTKVRMHKTGPNERYLDRPEDKRR